MGEMGICPVCMNPFAQGINEIPFMKKKASLLSKEQKQRRQKILEVTRKSTIIGAGQMRNQALFKLIPTMDSEIVVATRPCGHVFHKGCLRSYCQEFRSLEQKGLVQCPICKERIVVTSAVVLDLRALEGYSEVTEQKLKFSKVMNKELRDQYEPLRQKIENMKLKTLEEEQMLAELQLQANLIGSQWAKKKDEYNEIIAKIDQVKLQDEKKTKLELENRRLTSVYLKQLTHDLSCKPSQSVPKELHPYIEDIQKNPEVIDSFREVICPLPLKDQPAMSRTSLIKSIIQTVRGSLPTPTDDEKPPTPPPPAEPEVSYVEEIEAPQRPQPTHNPIRRQPKYRPEGRPLQRSLTPTSASSLQSESTLRQIEESSSEIRLVYGTASPLEEFRPPSPSTSDHADDEECNWEPLLVYNRKKTRRASYNRTPNFFRPRHRDSSEKSVRFQFPSCSEDSPHESDEAESVDFHDDAEAESVDFQNPCQMDSLDNLYDDLQRGYEWSKRLTENEGGDVTEDDDEEEERPPSRFKSEESFWEEPEDAADVASVDSPIVSATSGEYTMSDESIVTIRPVRQHRTRVPPPQRQRKSRSRSRSCDRALLKTRSANAILVNPDLRYPQLRNAGRIPSKATVGSSMLKNIAKSESNQNKAQRPTKPTRLNRIPFTPKTSNPSINSLGFSVEALANATQKRDEIKAAVPNLPSLTGLDIPTNEPARPPRPSRPAPRLKEETMGLLNALTSTLSTTDLIKLLETELLSKSLIRIESRQSQFMGLQERVSSISIIPPPENFQPFSQPEPKTPKPEDSMRQTIEMIERTLATFGTSTAVIEPPPLLFQSEPEPEIPKERPPTPRKPRLRPVRKLISQQAGANEPQQRHVWMRVPIGAIPGDPGPKIRPETRSKIVAVMPIPNPRARNDIRTPLEFSPRPGTRTAPPPKYARIRRLNRKPSEIPKLPSIETSDGHPQSQRNNQPSNSDATRPKNTVFDPDKQLQLQRQVRFMDFPPINSPKALKLPLDLRLSKISLMLPPGQLGDFMNPRL